MIPQSTRLYAADHPELAHTVGGRLQKEINGLLEGLLYTSEKDFRYSVGVIFGLRRAAEICEEIDREQRS